MKEVAVGDDEYSLLINLKRLYELQLKKIVSNDLLFEDMATILRDIKDLDNEVVAFLLLNMYLHVAWCLESINGENPSEPSVTSLLSKRTTLFEQLEYFADILSKVRKKRRSESVLSYRVCGILSEAWCLFKTSNYASTKLQCLGYCPDTSFLQKFWILCEQLVNISDETEEEDANEEYIEETNRDAVIIAASKLVATNTVPKDYLGPEIISHFVMHGASIAEIIKKLITDIKKSENDEISVLFLEALKRAYNRHVVDLSGVDDESLASKSFSDCKDLAARLSATFTGAARSTHRPGILKIIKDGVSFAFMDAPRQVSFLEGAVLPFVSKLPASDVLDILEDVKRRSANVNTDEDPSGWRPYYTFVNQLCEKYAKNEVLPDEKEGHTVRRRGRPRKATNIQGKKLFDAQNSSDDDSINASEQNERNEVEDEEENQPLIHTFRSSAAKLRSLRVPQQENGQVGTSRSAGSSGQARDWFQRE